MSTRSPFLHVIALCVSSSAVNAEATFVSSECACVIADTIKRISTGAMSRAGEDRKDFREIHASFDGFVCERVGEELVVGVITRTEFYGPRMSRFSFDGKSLKFKRVIRGGR